jgi:nicotinamide mononucleotide (NMN) deamidase PncC
VQSSSAVAGEDGGQTVEPGGYRYFGAARDLPGVKQLFFQQLPEGTPKLAFEDTHTHHRTRTTAQRLSVG